MATTTTLLKGKLAELQKQIGYFLNAFMAQQFASYAAIVIRKSLPYVL